MTHDILLMRHGQTEWNAIGRAQGRLNSALTAKGEDQARHLGAILSGTDLSGWDVVCSPSGRALTTAGLALGGGHIPIRTDERLMEIDVGDWSGRLMSEIEAENPALFPPHAERFSWYDAAPGGEGFAGLRGRCSGFLAEVRRPTVIVTHGITLRMLRSLILAGDDSRFDEGARVAQGVIYHLRDGQIHELRKKGDLSA